MNDYLRTKKIALVHDYLLRFGGAERVLQALHRMFPEAPIYSVVYDEDFVQKFFQGARVRASFLQHLPLFLRKRYAYFSFLIPTAVEQLDVSQFDVVLSSCSAFCKGVITRSDAIHISYCHTPTRFLWDWMHEHSRSLQKGILGLGVKILFHFLRLWDYEAARRVDYFIANSKHVAARIKKYYGKDAKVIYPPVEHLTPSTPLSSLRRGGDACLPAGKGGEVEKDYFLIVSQLRSYKQIDVAIEAFTKLGFPLVIIGEGPEKKKLMKRAKGFPHIEFLGWQEDSALSHYYKNCKAFIFPGEEDFGMAMAEAMLCGKPVLALRKGGALEIVLEGITGEFFDDAHPVVLADGVRRLLQNYPEYSPFLIAKRAEKFSRERFRKGIVEFIQKYCRMGI